jgi:transporter family-2 protein
MNWSVLAPIVMTVIAGAAVSLQPAFNSQLAGHLGSPLRAALVNFSAGALVMLSVVSLFALRSGLPSTDRIAQIPIHLWVIGGLLGALFVSTATWATPKIGAGAFFATLIAAQLIAGLILDHFGLVGLDQKPATLARLAGVPILIFGAWLIIRGA